MSTPELSKKEQRILARAKDKIKAINEDMLNSKGLTEAEVNVAAKAGLMRSRAEVLVAGIMAERRARS